MRTVDFCFDLVRPFMQVQDVSEYEVNPAELDYLDITVTKVTYFSQDGIAN